MASNLTKYLFDLNKLNAIEKISSGAFGIVYLVKDKKTSQKYAAKVLHSSEVEQSKIMINREIGIMIRMQHPTIIKFYGYSLTDFEGKDHVTLLLQFANKGSLADYLKKVRNGLADRFYDNTTRQKILVGIARGMLYLHKHNVIHRDLKPGNILLDENLEPHITDFGASKFYSSGQSNNLTLSVGTSIYMAPEVIEGGKYNGKADVYSFAILMFEVVTDTIPFESFQNGKMTLFQFNMKVVSENYRPEFKVPIKESIKSLIEQCWSRDPNRRPTFDEIYNRLAFNVEESVYDVFENDQEEPKYYLESVDQNELLFYVDRINDETVYDHSKNEEHSSSSEKVDKLNEKVEALENENKKLIKLVGQQSNEIDHLKHVVEEMSNKLESFINEKSKTKENNEGSHLYEYDGNPNHRFEGIIHHLRGSAKTNPSDAGIINVTSKTVDGNHYPKYAVDFDSNEYFLSDHGRDWLKYDFKDKKIRPTRYSIKTRNDSDDQNPVNWIIEVSNTDSDKDTDWRIIDSRSGVTSVSKRNRSDTFDIQTRLTTEENYRYIRFRCTGGTSGLYCGCLAISSLEYFGTLIE